MGVGNLLGQPFYKYVNKQVEVRQKVYGSGFSGTETTSNRRNASYNQYLNSRSAWLKMASSVVIMDKKEITEETVEGDKNTYTDPGGVRFLEKLKLPKSYMGINLAREAVLFSGLQGTGNIIPSTEEDPLASSFKGNTTFKQRVGIAKGQKAWNLDSAYGLGGREYGQQPMPGITNFSIKSLNRGSLKRAEVSIKANNKYQFELLETLYLRLGYSMMIEWGYSHYLPNTGGMTTTNEITGVKQTIPLVDTVKNTYIEEKWFQQIGAEQKEVLKDVERYRVKYSGNYDGFFGKVVNFSWKFNSDGTYDINISLISLGDIIESLKFNSLHNSSDGMPVDSGQDVNDITNKLNQIRLSPEKFNDNFWPVTNEFAYQFISLNENIDYVKAKDGQELPESTQLQNNISSQQQKYGFYWRFGNMLKWIEQFIIPNYSSGNNMFKQINIDFNEIANIMAVYPNQFSIDPRVCIVKTEYGDKLNFIKGEKPSFYKYMVDWVDTETVPESPHAKIMNIYINFDQIITIINSNKNKKGDIDFYTFFSKLLDNINRALGGINNLELVVEEDSNTLKIIDQNPVPGSATKKKSKTNFYNKFIKDPRVSENSTMLELYGYNFNGSTYQSNFVKDFNFETKIDKNYANTLAIAAAAGGVSVGEDATAFSKWGYGLVDKYKETITPPDKDTNVTSSGENPYILVNTFQYFDVGKVISAEGFSTDPMFYESRNQTFDENGNIVPIEGFDSSNEGKILYPYPGTSDNYGKLKTGTEEFITPEGQKLIDNIRTNIFNSDISYYITECFGSDATGQTVPTIIANNTEDKADIIRNAQSGNSQNTSGQRIKRGGYYNDFNSDIISRGEAAMKNYLYFMAKEHYKKTNSPTGAGGFMPLDLNVTVDGISGIKIFNGINVDTRFLPSAYGEDLDFIVKGVNHKVSNGEWTTEISSLSIPRPTLQIYEKIENEITVTSSILPDNPEDAFTEPVFTPVRVGDANYTIRMDSEGKGLFGAPRMSSTHKGLDFLAIKGDTTYAPISGQITRRTPNGKGVLDGFSIKGEGVYEGLEVIVFYTTVEFQSNLIGTATKTYLPNRKVKQGDEIGTVMSLLPSPEFNMKPTGYTDNATNRQNLQNHIHIEFRLNGEVVKLQSSADQMGNLTNWQSEPNKPAAFTIQSPNGVRTEGINELDAIKITKDQFNEYKNINRLIRATVGDDDEGFKVMNASIKLMSLIVEDSWDNPDISLRTLANNELTDEEQELLKINTSDNQLLDTPLRAFVNTFIINYIYYKNLSGEAAKFNQFGVKATRYTYELEVNPLHPDAGKGRELVFIYNFQRIFAKFYQSPNNRFGFDSPVENAFENYYIYGETYEFGSGEEIILRYPTALNLPSLNL